MLTIWGRKNSSNVMPVLWTADELGLAYDHKMVGGSFGGIDTDAFRAMNPNMRVPGTCGSMAGLAQNHPDRAHD